MAKQKSPRVHTAIKVFRLERRETLDDVAKATNTTRSHIWALERGRVVDPGLSILLALARHFGCSLDVLVGNAGSPAIPKDVDPLDTIIMSKIGMLGLNKKKLLLSIVDTLRCPCEGPSATEKAA